MKRVLVVDDFAGVRLFHVSLLKSAGFEATPASSGEEAVRAYESMPFDLIVLDLIMPGMGGLEVLRRLRSNRALGKMPVIVITSEAEAIPSGDPYTRALVKPVLPRQLLEAAREMTHERTSHVVG